MLLLLVPGVGMGATATGGLGGDNSHLLMLMGVGRSIVLPFLWIVRSLTNGG